MYVETGASGRAIVFAAGRGDEKLPLLVALSLFDFDFDFNDDDTDDAEEDQKNQLNWISIHYQKKSRY